MCASPLPGASAEALQELSSPHTDTGMLRARPQRRPKWRPEAGQFSFGTEGPYPSLSSLGFGPGKGDGLQGKTSKHTRVNMLS